MDSLLPKLELSHRFERPVRYEELGLTQLEEIANRKPESLFELGLTVWTHHLEQVPLEDPKALAEFVDSDDPYLVSRIAEFIEQPVLHDINYSIGQLDDDRLDYLTVAELLTAVVYPGYLHISDLQFSDPYRPIEPSKRKYQFKRYVGLGLFGALLESARAFARDAGLSYLSLTAAGPDLRPFFESFGFQVEDNAAGRYGVETGQSIPMRQRV